MQCSPWTRGVCRIERRTNSIVHTFAISQRIKVCVLKFFLYCKVVLSGHARNSYHYQDTPLVARDMQDWVVYEHGFRYAQLSPPSGHKSSLAACRLGSAVLEMGKKKKNKSIIPSKSLTYLSSRPFFVLANIVFQFDVHHNQIDRMARIK